MPSNRPPSTAQPLLRCLREYGGRHPEESHTVQRFTDLIRQCSDCFDRERESGHLTASAWLVDASASKVLLTHHRKLNIWVQLGGHADGDKNLLRAALREAREESGMEALTPVSESIFDIDIHAIPARPGKDGSKAEPAHLHYDVRFALQAGANCVPRVGPESHDLAWAEIHRIEEFTSEVSILRMAARWLAGWPDPATL